ncbi:MAG: LLM class flavin-dependent oxidoreductase [Candidatus Binatus sp.]|uniref:LLM class flavin-dependent oxidoreductase n=1 Tax=Candidatus Binatus sp. TaxID=2811406 RepID=UPI0027246CA9|nr:LLM class flavin-dependent oxidoreductase [Candidatus Binatus sp.]MDO8433809.1 LLM class flavin-dependent oxidoreductase [Candidatus Binatus sp.]
MKFHWFAEVTYPHLPADFRERFPSAWVTPPAHLIDPLKAGEMYRMFIRLMQLADEVGFDGLTVNEHHQTPLAVTPSPNLLAASLASTTKNAAIVIVGNSLALYNPPTRVAEEYAYLDCLSGGRLTAGFVLGTPMDSVFAYGMGPAEVRARFEEARQLILRAWSEPEPFAFNGKYNQLRYVNVWPRPVQKKLPIWVPGGGGSVETWDLVIDHDYCYGHLSFSGLYSSKPLVDAFWDYVNQRGGTTNPHRMAFTQIVCVADTDAEAEKQYYEAVRYFHRNATPAAGFLNPPGYTTIKSTKFMSELAKKTHSKLTPEDRIRAARGEMSFWEYDEKGYIIAGTPARVRQRLRELIVDLRIGQLIATPHMGNLPEEVGAQNTTLFGREVAPYLRDLWADQPDHWTPEISQRLVAANAPKPRTEARTMSRDKEAAAAK